MPNFTHQELTVIAANWLKNYCRCPVVARELVAYTSSGETPDAIGWRSHHSILVECKISKSDFLADQKKPSRALNKLGHPALGNYRFYLTPEGILKEDDIPEGWGLYEVNEKGKVRHKYGVKYIYGSRSPNKSCLISEKAILISIIRRLNNWNNLIVSTRKKEIND